MAKRKKKQKAKRMAKPTSVNVDQNVVVTVSGQPSGNEADAALDRLTKPYRVR